MRACVLQMLELEEIGGLPKRGAELIVAVNDEVLKSDLCEGAQWYASAYTAMHPATRCYAPCVAMHPAPQCYLLLLSAPRLCLTPVLPPGHTLLWA